MPRWIRPTDAASLMDLDRLTDRAAVAVSRRLVLKGAIGAAAALAGAGWFEPLVATADYCHNNCNSVCSNCYTESGFCCSPNGQNCWSASCSCDPCGSCGCFYAWTWVCDSGAHSNGCSPFCWC